MGPTRAGRNPTDTVPICIGGWVRAAWVTGTVMCCTHTHTPASYPGPSPELLPGHGVEQSFPKGQWRALSLRAKPRRPGCHERQRDNGWDSPGASGGDVIAKVPLCLASSLPRHRAVSGSPASNIRLDAVDATPRGPGPLVPIPQDSSQGHLPGRDKATLSSRNKPGAQELAHIKPTTTVPSANHNQLKSI